MSPREQFENQAKAVSDGIEKFATYRDGEKVVPLCVPGYRKPVIDLAARTVTIRVNDLEHVWHHELRIPQPVIR